MKIKNKSIVVVNNTPLWDKKLSLAAKGMAAILMACQTEFNIKNPELLSEESQKAIEDLKAHGYLKESTQEGEFIFVVEGQSLGSVNTKKPKVRQTPREFCEKFYQENPSTYPVKMYADFLGYWEEKSSSGQQRWQAEEFFDVALRLRRWHENNKTQSHQTTTSTIKAIADR